MPRRRRLFHHHESAPTKLLNEMSRRDPGHHLARYPELLPAVELEGVGEGLLKLRSLGGAEARGRQLVRHAGGR